MPVTIVVFTVYFVSETGCKGGLFWGTKKVFRIFFQKKNHHLLCQFYAKMIKKRHQIRDFADFQWFRCAFFSNL
jgi:hypothetical protein